jgi:hypothetical protein
MSQECEECHDKDVAAGNLRWCASCHGWVEGLNGSFLCSQCSKITSAHGPMPTAPKVVTQVNSEDVSYIMKLVASLKMEAEASPPAEQKDEFADNLRLLCRKMCAAADVIEYLLNKIKELEAKDSK